MRILKNNILWLLVVVCGLAACEDANEIVNGYYETTDDNSTVVVLKGYVSSSEGFSICTPDGCDYPFYIVEQQFYGEKYEFAEGTATRLDAMSGVPSTWVKTVDIAENATYWAKYSSMTTYVYIKFRVALIEGNDVTIEYVVDSSEARPNTNANSSATAYATNWEMPALNADNYFVAHTVSVSSGDVLNYSLEWNSSMKHAEWVAFSFDETTCQDVTSRTDAWDVDPLLPSDMQTNNSYHTNDGFDRGHLCASEDRVWSVDANEQTFYFSNMSPQIGTFNQNFWADLETQVRTWGRAIPSTYDKVYVAKGGTLNNLLKGFTGMTRASDGQYPTTDENGFTTKGLACPAYYFMAILSEKDGDYNAIAFLVPHSEDLPKEPTTAELQEYVVTIDSLETFTGLDFFCNLPDDLETEVESAVDLSAWAW
ncbi:MAG: DNA/RNA non-specific endonuclease [Bacteroides sp.]|nr:DNA/RNA non-specific endonuclease [Bacteroides sp.]